MHRYQIELEIWVGSFDEFAVIVVATEYPPLTCRRPRLVSQLLFICVRLIEGGNVGKGEREREREREDLVRVSVV